jgi:hypothetical protein
MWAPIRDRQGILAAFTTAPTLIHTQVIAYGVYIMQSIEDIAA